MGTYDPVYRDGYEVDGTFKNLSETGKTVQEILENHTEDVECSEERM